MFRRGAVAVLAVGLLLVPAGAWAAKKPPIELSYCGNTILTPGVYRLTQDIECLADDNFVDVEAENVTIDLGGHTVKGSGMETRGVEAFHRLGLKIRNGTLTGFTIGILIRSGPLNVSDMVLAANDRGILNTGIDSGSASGPSVLTRTVVANSTSDGVELRGKSTITSTRIVSNGGIGMDVGGNAYPAHGTTITNSIFDSNHLSGLRMHASNATVRNSRANGNGSADFQYGMYIDGDNVRVLDSVVSGNYAEGIRIDGEKARVDGNIADGNGWASGSGTEPGILNQFLTNAPKGKNRARGNASTACAPVALCTFVVKAPKNAITFNACGLTADQPGATYLLTQDVTCSDDGVSIDADNITIDLGGHTMHGAGGSTTHGVVMTDPSGVATIRNGTLERFGYGVSVQTPLTPVTVSSVAVVQNVNYGFEIFASTVSMSNTAAVRNGNHGYWLGGHDTVRSSHAVYNLGDGFRFEGVTGSTVRQSSASANAKTGFRLLGGDIAVDKTIVAGNGYASGDDGVVLSGTDATMTRSGVFGNHVRGLRVVTLGGTINKNTVTGNGWGAMTADTGGIKYEGGGTLSGHNVARGNFGTDPHPSNDCFPNTLC